jgi:hypothetical protein
MSRSSTVSKDIITDIITEVAGSIQYKMVAHSFLQHTQFPPTHSCSFAIYHENWTLVFTQTKAHSCSIDRLNVITNSNTKWLVVCTL